MLYFINGHKVSSKQAFTLTRDSFLSQGGDPAEFYAVWNSHDCEYTGDEKRELLNEWSGYVVEIMTEEQEAECED